MLRFVTKADYWAAEDAGMLDLYEQTDWWHIKTIQDAVVLHAYHHLGGQTIAEIGGDQGRILRCLAKSNVCCNIEAVRPDTGGSSTLKSIPGVRSIQATVGEFSEAIPSGTFDILFSISVLEHVPESALWEFFQDCHRMLKPGGEMMHLIDLYVEDDPEGNEDANRRVDDYRAALDGRLFAPFEADMIQDGDIHFSCAYASNPDNMMNRWNKRVPHLRDKRARSQAVTLMMRGRRAAD